MWAPNRAKNIQRSDSNVVEEKGRKSKRGNVEISTSPDFVAVRPFSCTISSSSSTSNMSQTNPRKAALRTPNGTDTSPAAASSDAPSQPVPQPIHHPLPKHPHTYIPAHLKSNGPRTQYSKGRSSKSNAPDESPEVKALRAKYGDKLSNLKETFGNWGDEDLLSLLSESNGNVDSVATSILEGELNFLLDCNLYPAIFEFRWAISKPRCPMGDLMSIESQ